MTPPPTAATVEPTLATVAGPAPGAGSAPRAVGPLAGGALVLIAMLLVALNLRVAITSLGALLDDVRGGLGLSGTMAGVVTTLPTLAFAVFGAITPRLVRRHSPARLLVVAMALLTAGQLIRVAVDSAAVFIAASALALAGIAVANVLLPLLVKQHFPHRVGLVTGAYSMALTIGASVAAATAVPVAHLLGSWQAGLAVWAGLAAVAVLPWVPLALRARAARRTATTTAAGADRRPSDPRAPGSGGRWRSTSGPSRSARTRSWAGWPSSSATPGSRHRPPACCSPEGPRWVCRSRC